MGEYKDFNSFVSALINYYLKNDSDMNINKLAEKTGLSVSFIQKAIYTPKEKHFNLRHVFLISSAMKVSIERLLPSKENFKILTGKTISESTWNSFLDGIKKGE